MLTGFTSPAARTSLIYITIGALALVWSTVWLVYLLNNPPESNGVYYLLAGCLASGITALLIGFGLGKIGSAARIAETTPIVTTPVVTTPAVIPPAATIPPAVVPSASTAPVAERPETEAFVQRQS